MPKFCADAVQDAALAKIATSINLTFCSAQPANKAGIAAVALAAAVLTAGNGNGDYVISDGDVSGRKLRTLAQTEMTPSANGTIAYAAWDDGTTLLYGTTVTNQAVTMAQTWDSPDIDIEYTDPT